LASVAKLCLNNRARPFGGTTPPRRELLPADLFTDVREAIQRPQDSRARRSGETLAHPPPRPAGARCGRREKMFGVGRPRPLDRNAEARVMHLARCLMRRTEKGRAYGAITAKALAVLKALLWGFHNAKSGLCFPSYEGSRQDWSHGVR